MTLGPLRFTNALGGTADFIYPGPTVDMQSPASANAVDGATYLIYAQAFDMSQWEISLGAYTLSSGTFARTSIKANSLGTTAKINFAHPPQVFVVDSSAGAGTRERLTAARTYYVRADGSDSNTGLVNSAGGAFLTLQMAANVVANLDLNGFNVTIQVGTGTYEGGVFSSVWVGKGTVTLTGDTTTPSNCLISSSTLDCVQVNGFGSQLSVQGFKVATSGTNCSGLLALNGGIINITGKMEFGDCNLAWARSFFGGIINGTTVTSILLSGNSNLGFHTQNNSVLQFSPCTVTVTKNITVGSQFATCFYNSIFEAAALTFSLGAFSVTGKRFACGNLGIIDTNGGGVNFFPGSVAGTGTNPGVSPWGLYL